MKQVSYIFIFLLLFYCASITSNHNLTEYSLNIAQPRFRSSSYRYTNQSSTGMYSPSARISASYEAHPPINIGNNSDFMAQAISNNWPGEGTSLAPYLIEGLNISGPLDTALLEIRNTDVFFSVSNCIFERGGNGIRLIDMTNGVILENSVTNNFMNGIYITQSWNNTIYNNTLTKNGYSGILVRDSPRNTISGNSITNNRARGIYLQSSSSNTISSNIVTANGENGVSLGSSWGNFILSNTVTNNSGSGISVGSSWNNTISNNIVTDNNPWGIYITNSFDIIATWNDFIDNNRYESSQAFDEGNDNLFAHNYWNEWTEPDKDRDGIVDLPYHIDGSANNQDYFPRTSVPVASPIEHIITSSILFLIFLVLLGIFIIQQRKN